jgi:glutamine synthetase
MARSGKGEARPLTSRLSGIKYAILHFSDLSGLLKGRTIPGDEITDALKNGVGFDGSSIPGYVEISKSDMVMKPDPKTFALFPEYFYGRSVANFICDTFRPTGKRFESDPRYISERSEETIRAQGYEPTAAAELEFYLAKNDGNGIPLPIEAHLSDHQRYFDITPGRDLTETYRMDLADALSGMGITIERHHHEVGASQNEITFKFSTPTETADRIMRYKFVAKGVADRRYGSIATFMPKPWYGKAGNGMHVHLGLKSSGGRNLFYDPEGYACVSQTCRYFIGGLMEHAKALSAVVAPTVNSYKRLVPGYEAPVYVAWSKGNRSAFVRIPDYFPGNESEARLEFRCPDPLCNPYLAYAVLFEAGMDGIKRKIEPGDPVEENIYHLSDARRKELGVGTLPSSLKEAFEAWQSDDLCIKALGKDTAEKLRDMKMAEWREYEASFPKPTSEVTPWELDRYLLA